MGQGHAPGLLGVLTCDVGGGVEAPPYDAIYGDERLGATMFVIETSTSLRRAKGSEKGEL